MDRYIDDLDKDRISDLFVIIDLGVKARFGLSWDDEVLLIDRRSFYWIEADNNQIAFFYGGRQSFWPIKNEDRIEIGDDVICMFRGGTNRIFFLDKRCKTTREFFDKIERDMK